MAYEDFGDLHYDVERCRAMLDDEEFGDAFDLATDLIERAPSDLDVASVYCDAALAAGHPGKAVRVCAGFLKRGEEDPEILEWLARAQWDLHLPEQCRATCRRILARDAENYTALDYGLATALELGDFEDTRDLVDMAAACATPDAHLTYQTAVARMMRGEEAWARKRFEQFLEEEPEEPGTYINLMRIHHLAKRYAKVEQIYDLAVDRDIEHEDLEFNMGLAMKAQGRDREAASFFARTVRLNPDLPDAHFHLGQILRMEGHPRLALAMLERELRVDDTHPSVHAEMAWCCEDTEDFPAALRMIRAAVERAPEWGVYLHSLAELLLKADWNPDEAREAARRAVQLDPDHAAGWQVLGRLAAEAEDIEEAERLLRKAVASRDATVEDEGWLGLVLAESRQDQDARPFLERAVRTFPFWDPVGHALGRIRGHPIPCRFEVRLKGRGPEPWFRVLHVVAGDEDGARRAAQGVAAGVPAEGDEIFEDVRPLGFDIDHGPGIVWDSGPDRNRFPPPPDLPD